MCMYMYIELYNQSTGYSGNQSYQTKSFGANTIVKSPLAIVISVIVKVALSFGSHDFLRCKPLRRFAFKSDHSPQNEKL